MSYQPLIVKFDKKEQIMFSKSINLIIISYSVFQGLYELTNPLMAIDILKKKFEKSIVDNIRVKLELF